MSEKMPKPAATNPAEDVVRPGNKSSETWEARKEFVFGQEHFDFQMQFAREMHERTGEPLLDIVANYTSLLRFDTFEYDEEDRLIGAKPGVTEENIVDIAYQEYFKTVKDHPIGYHREWKEGARFGCFYYDRYDDEPEAVGIHFMNTEFDTKGPLDREKRAERGQEMRDVLTDIKARQEGITEMRGKSWLYNVPAYRSFFPESYLQNLHIDDDPSQWRRGTTIWGQFMDSQYHLKQDLANELLTRVRQLPKHAPLSDIFKENSPLMPPLMTHGPIEDFYKMYGIE